ncbi:hypothetical protein GF327_01435 [Candidatus Woesearchaeota archaeon]|nr:hypothetical protein [Candidatus Woesearchaeota archaeon]
MKEFILEWNVGSFIDTKDFSVCSNVENNDWCFGRTARTLKSPKPCLDSGSYRDECLESYVLSSKDLSACNLIIENFELPIN